MLINFEFFSLGSFELEPVCGRPEGMGLHPSGALYILDAYNGLLRLNLTTRELVTVLTRTYQTILQVVVLKHIKKKKN